ncbi:MAG TPA: hypothetical protein VFA50_00905 [Stellaceae bacterium]|nr:hypothetical protein [Stellaceae bacterium]
MKVKLASVCLCVVLVSVPLMTAAAPAIRGIMHGWRADARRVHEILSDRVPFDDRVIRTTLQTYISDAGAIEAQIAGKTAAARDFKQRFMTFAANARTALADLGQAPALKKDFARLMSDCQACHDAFAH